MYLGRAANDDDGLRGFTSSKHHVLSEFHQHASGESLVFNWLRRRINYRSLLRSFGCWGGGRLNGGGRSRARFTRAVLSERQGNKRHSASRSEYSG
jgi:hypothetical protein